MPIQDLTPQLRTRLRKVEWLTGLFLGVTALLMVGGFVYFLKHTAEARGWFISYVPYYTYLPDATGFKEGTPVKMMGFAVGEITKVTAVSMEERGAWDYYQTNDYNVFVAFKVKAPFYGYIGADSKIRIGGFPIELAGGNFLELTPASHTNLVTVQKLPNGKPAGVLWEKYAYDHNTNLIKYGALTNGQKGYYLQVDESETLLAQAQRILKNADDITVFLRGDLPRVANEVVETLTDARTTLDTVQQSVVSLTNDVVLTLITARQSVAALTNDLVALIANTRRITGQVSDVIPGLTNDLANTLATSRRLMDSVDRQLPSMANNVNLTLTNVNTLLMRDPNILLNASVLVSNVNNLITKHWLFRSAFKGRVAPPPSKPTTAPTPDRGETERSLRPGSLRGGGRL